MATLWKKIPVGPREEMAKQITQKTFDDAVRENIEEFEMTADEAINDAVQQFESQGVNLNNIVRDARLFSEDGAALEHPVVEAIKKLKLSLSMENCPPGDITQSMAVIRTECEVDLSRRCLAGNNEGYPTLKKALEKYKSDEACLSETLVTVMSLFDGQPDLLDDSGCCLLMEFLDIYLNNEELLILTIKIIKLTCTKHEANRQMFVKKGLINKLTEILNKRIKCSSIVIQACAALRILTLDNDVRVPFGKAHEHAKMIVTEGNALQTLLDLCKEYSANPNVLKELFSTMTKLVVRDEFCKTVMDLGGLDFILQAFQDSINDKGIVRQALGVIKALAGNDNVKVAVVSKGGMDVILAAIMKHQANAAIAELGCATIAAVVLRNPAHCAKVMDLSGHQVIVQAMKIHKEQANVQNQACMALRNIVARTREYCDPILELGTEALINEARQSHKDCHDDAKAALRDLGCQVELKELWKGEKAGIN